MATNDPEDVLSQLPHGELKQVVKDAIKEWLDEQALLFGKWTLRWVAMAAGGALLYFILTAQGWTHK